MRVPAAGVLGDPPATGYWALANGSVFAGIDCDTRGLADGENPLSRIGVALGPVEVFASSITEGTASEAVDAELVRWMEARSVPERSIIAVGWNVSGGHLARIRRALPAFSSRYLTERSIALDTICYALADNKTYGDFPTSFEEWQALAKRAAELHAKIGYEVDPAWDDAGYSALTSLLGWRWLCAIVADPRPATWQDRTGA